MTQLETNAEERIAEEAAEWLERLKQPTVETRAAYQAWLRQSPLHVREILLATAWDKVLDDLKQQGPPAQSAEHGATPAQPAATCARPPRRSPVFTVPWRFAGACFVLLACACLYMSSNSATSHRTRLGEQQSIQLEDGSLVRLNTLTELRTRYDEHARAIHLVSGQATFDVRHDPARPFTVHVGEHVIRAVGTQFDVHVEADSLTVTVLDGAVAVESTGLNKHLTGGQRLRVTPQGAHALDIDLQEAIAWQQRRLIVRNQSLNEIAAEFNRYNKRKLVIDAALAERRYSGVFDATDPETFASSLQSDPAIKITHSKSVLVVSLATPGPEAHSNE